MSISGTLTLTDDGGDYEGRIASLTFDTPIRMTPNGRKTEDRHPDYVISGQSPKGTPVPVGAAWTRTGKQSGNDYMSLSIDLGTGSVNANAFPATEGDMSELVVRPFAS